VVGLLLILAPLQERIHSARPRLFDPEQRVRRASAITIGPTAGVIAALGGFRTVAADLLWLRVERAWHGGNWWAIIPLLDAVVELDPHFLLAWKVYGWHCAYNLHVEAQTLVDKRYWLQRGLQVLERGVEANPGRWDLYFELGWTYYDRAHDAYRAAEWFRRADEFPDAPAYVTRLVYRPFERILDFDRLFPAIEYARAKHLDDHHHQRIVNRDLEWWTTRQDDPQEHRRQIVIENTRRHQRAIPFHMYPDNPYWDVCPRCGMPSAKDAQTCANCGYERPPEGWPDVPLIR